MKQLNWRGPLFLCLGVMFAPSSESTGFCKYEVALPNGEDYEGRRLRRSSHLREIDGTLHAYTSTEPLGTVVADRDKATIKPPPLQVGKRRCNLGCAPHLANF